MDFLKQSRDFSSGSSSNLLQCPEYVNLTRVITSKPLTSLPQRISKTVDKVIEELEMEYEDEMNALIAAVPTDSEYYAESYEDESKVVLADSLNMIFYGPARSFLRMDAETILHIFQHVDVSKITNTRCTMAWNIISDGKATSFLTGRDFLPFATNINFIPEQDLFSVNFGDPAVLHFFAEHSNLLNKSLRGILVTSFKRYYGRYWYTNASTINSVGKLICSFQVAELKLISPAVFKEVKTETWTSLEDCSWEQLKVLYNIATDRNAYKDPYTWGAHDIVKLGALLTCIPNNELSSLNQEAISAISSDVMKSLDQRKLQFFSKSHISVMNERARRICIIRLRLLHGATIENFRKSSCRVKTTLLVFLPIFLIEF